MRTFLLANIFTVQYCKPAPVLLLVSLLLSWVNNTIWVSCLDLTALYFIFSAALFSTCSSPCGLPRVQLRRYSLWIMDVGHVGTLPMSFQLLLPSTHPREVSSDLSYLMLKETSWADVTFPPVSRRLALRSATWRVCWEVKLLLHTPWSCYAWSQRRLTCDYLSSSFLTAHLQAVQIMHHKPILYSSGCLG